MQRGSRISFCTSFQFLRLTLAHLEKQYLSFAIALLVFSTAVLVSFTNKSTTTTRVIINPPYTEAQIEKGKYLSEEQFIIAMTEGKSKGIRMARPLLPPMPWPNYVHVKKEDLVAAFAYLKSSKPIANIVPQPIAPDKL